MLTEVGCTKAFGFDITAACSGFIVGLITATCYIKGNSVLNKYLCSWWQMLTQNAYIIWVIHGAVVGGGVQNVLVVGADALSKFVDWTDRGTCILFGDAAGAVLVQV